MTIKDRSRQRGAALLNLALALSVGLMLSVGAFAISAIGLDKSKSEQALSDVREISEAIFAIYANKATFAGLDVVNLKASGLIPDELWSGSELRSAYGAVRVWPASIGGGCGSYGYCDNGFTLSVTGLRTEGCQQLAVAKLGARVQYTAVGYGPTWTKIADGTTSEVQSACTADPEGGKTVTWYFG